MTLPLLKKFSAPRTSKSLRAYIFLPFLVFAQSLSAQTNDEKIFKFEPSDRQKIGFLLDMLRKGIRYQDTVLLNEAFDQQVFDSTSNAAVVNYAQHLLSLVPASVSPSVAQGLSRFDFMLPPVTASVDFDLRDSAIVVAGDSATVHCSLFFWGAAIDSLGQPMPIENWKAAETLIF